MKIEEIGKLNIYISDGNYSSKYPRSNEFVKEGIPFIRANNFKNHTILNVDLLFINKDKHATPKKGHLKTGDVLITTRGNIGNTAIVPSSHNDSNINAQIVLLRPDASIDSKYLMIIFQLPEVQKQITALTTGTALKQLPVGHLKKIKIPVPDISTQLHIANILTKAENLIAQRKESICMLDEFLKSTFLEMFGDPVRNEKGWETKQFDELVAEDCPLTYGIVQPGNEFPNGIPVIRPVNLTQTFITKNGLKLIDPKISDKFKRTILKGGELLMCVRGTTGVTSIATNELFGCNVTRGITPIWFSENYNNLFAFHLLRTQAIRNKIQELTYGATLKQINLGDLRKIKLINPKIVLQNRFAQFVEKTEALKAQYQKSLIELENLYGSLSQKAFRGELSFKNENLMIAVELDASYKISH